MMELILWHIRYDSTGSSWWRRNKHPVTVVYCTPYTLASPHHDHSYSIVSSLVRSTRVGHAGTQRWTPCTRRTGTTINRLSNQWWFIGRQSSRAWIHSLYRGGTLNTCAIVRCISVAWCCNAFTTNSHTYTHKHTRRASQSWRSVVTNWKEKSKHWSNHLP